MTNSIMRDRVWMSVSGTPGTGNVTLNAALSGYRSASAAGVADQETNTWTFLDGTAWEVSSCVYTASGTSLARTLIASSTGSLLSLSSAATAFIDAASVDLQDLNASIFGTGFDGNVTVSSGQTTLTRDMYYNNLTLSGTGQILTKGYRIYVAGNLDISAAAAGAIQCNGGAGGNSAALATGGTAGAAAFSSSTLAGAADAGTAGNAGQTGAGTAGTAQGAIQSQGGGTGASGAGGAGSSGTAGAAGANTNTTSFWGMNPGPWPLQPMSYSGASSTAWGSNGLNTRSSHKGESGGSGGGDATNRGGACGGGGGCAGPVWIAANTIIRGASTAVGAIQSIGGAAGSGFAPTTGNCGGAGGSSGAGGGGVFLMYARLLGATATNCVDVTGGNGAAGTNGIGTGAGGSGGSSGASGIVYTYNLNGGGWSSTNSVAAVAGSANSGITGGGGGTATTTRFSL